MLTRNQIAKEPMLSKDCISEEAFVEQLDFDNLNFCFYLFYDAFSKEKLYIFSTKKEVTKHERSIRYYNTSIE